MADLEASKENLTKEVEELTARNLSLEKKLTSSKSQVRIMFELSTFCKILYINIQHRR